MKIYFSNSGCSAENVDFNRLLVATGAEQASNPFEADVIIAHFCGISTDAFKTIPEPMVIFETIKKESPETKVYVGGCASSVVDFKKMYPFVDGTFRRGHIIEDLASQLGYNLERLNDIPASFYGVVRIQSGCMRNCGFCKKAYMDMTLSSRPINLVIKDIEESIAKGYPEIVLMAENSTEYGFDLPGNVGLLDLLKEVVKIKGIKAIRVTALCIDEFAMPQNKELLQFIKVCNLIYQVQLEIQSLIPEERKAMKLTSSVEDVLRILHELESKQIMTNIMVGYPEETEEGFNQQLELIRNNNLYYVQFNKYDDTPMVYGHSLKQIDPAVVSKRLIMLASIIKELRAKRVRELIEVTKNKPVSCVFTSESRWAILGETAVVNLGKINASPGDIIKARITGSENLFNMEDPNQSLCLKGVRV